MEERHYFIDSNILMGHIRQKSPTVFDAALRDYGLPYISMAAVYEFELGERLIDRDGMYRAVFDDLFTVDINHRVALYAAELQAHLIRANQRLHVMDVMVAATALAYDMPLLSTNIRHFERVPSLVLLPLPPR